MRTLLPLAVLCASAVLTAQEQKTDAAAVGAPMPNAVTEHHYALAAFAGRWDNLCKMWPMPGVPRVEWLGIYPTRESVFLQAATAAVLLLGFWYTGRTPAADR